jgi:hypothetical protein
MEIHFLKKSFKGLLRKQNKYLPLGYQTKRKKSTLLYIYL